MTEREFALALRRAARMVLAARAGRGPAVPVATVAAILQVIADIERYCGAERGLGRVLKPLLIAALMGDTVTDPLAAFVAAIDDQFPA